jgi:hypothetical protein
MAGFLKKGRYADEVMQVLDVSGAAITRGMSVEH